MTTQHLYGQFADQLAAFIRRRVRRAPDAEDVLQQVFLNIHRHLQRHDPPRNLRGWVHQIARHAIIDHARRTAVRPAAAPGGDALPAIDRAVSDDDDPTQEAMRSLSRCVKAMIEGLPEPYADALRLTELQGWTQDQAARQAGVSISGMKSRVQRGRDKLRQALLDCCEIQLDARRTPIAHRCKTQCGCDEPSTTTT